MRMKARKHASQQSVNSAVKGSCCSTYRGGSCAKETLKTANRILVDFHHQLPLSVWGEGSHSKN
jgi:hypothetical protein